MPCSARKSSNGEPTLPFFLCVISEHLLHTLARESQILSWGLLRFLDEAVQQYHAFPRHAENHPPDLSISQVAARLPQTATETATVRHAERPPEFDLLNVPADQLAILQGQRQDPLPHGPVAEGGFIEEGRELLGTVDQYLLCQKWHILARTSCFGWRRERRAGRRRVVASGERSAYARGARPA